MVSKFFIMVRICLHLKMVRNNPSLPSEATSGCPYKCLGISLSMIFKCGFIIFHIRLLLWYKMPPQILMSLIHLDFLLSYLRVCVSAMGVSLQFVLILFIEALSMSHFVLSFQHFMIYFASLEYLVIKTFSLMSLLWVYLWIS